MAHTLQAKKRVRQNEVRRLHNKHFKTLFRKNYKKTLELIAQNKMEEAKNAVILTYKCLDKAVSKGVIHWKTAARKKSRLLRRFNKSFAQK